MHTFANSESLMSKGTPVDEYSIAGRTYNLKSLSTADIQAIATAIVYFFTCVSLLIKMNCHQSHSTTSLHSTAH